MKRFLPVLVCVSILAGHAVAEGLSPAELAGIGRKVWVNECDGSVAGLTSWNEGEAFASLGIGHFIWYPAGRPGPFEESFPQLVRFLEVHGQTMPAWLHGPCPWSTRSEFMAAQSSARMNELRTLLAETVPTQAQFLARRMRDSLPKMTAAAPEHAGLVQANFERLAATGRGTFELIDYVNFKGEGTLATERYDGKGWGLLQVLETMPTDGDAVKEFAVAAKAVLARRVKNAPAARNEAQWLAGWDARIARY